MYLETIQGSDSKWSTEAGDRQSQAEELQCVTYEQILQDEDNSRRLIGEAEPYLDKGQRPYTSHP